MENNEPVHELYPKSDLQNCDAVAWAFLDKNTMKQYPFKFPAIKPDEIRANILYSGLCQSDVHVAREKWNPAKFPITPGHEIIAEVSQVGSDVKDFKVGDKVGFGAQRNSCKTCKACEKSLEPICKGLPIREMLTVGLYWGGYATQLQHPAHFFFHLPENFDLKRGAALLCAGITVYKPIVEHIRPKDKAAVVGIGGLGHLAVQFLAKMGYDVTAVTTSNDKDELIKKLGASNIVNINKEDQVKANLGSFDFIMNTASTFKEFGKLVSLAAPKCKIIQLGAPEASDRLTLGTFELLMKEIELIGSSGGGKKAMNEMLEFCAKNDVYPLNEEFSFEDWPKAVDTLEHGRPKFRCVVNVVDYAKKNNLFK